MLEKQKSDKATNDPQSTSIQHKTFAPRATIQIASYQARIIDVSNPPKTCDL